MLKSWVLKKYLNEKKERMDLVSARSRDIGLYPFSLMTEDTAVAPLLNEAFFDVSTVTAVTPVRSRS